MDTNHDGNSGAGDEEQWKGRLEQEVAGLSEAVLEAASRLGRDDLAGRARAISSRFDARRTRVLVAGDFKVGKSTLVNGLVNAEICPVDDRRSTAAMTVVTYGEEPAAHWVRSDDDGRSVRTPVTIDELRRTVREREPPECSAGESAVAGLGEVCVPRRILAKGLTLVDTPGVGGLEGNTTRLLAAAVQADAVLFVTDAGQELTAAELDFLRRAHELRPVLVVMTKVDFYPAWRRILELDRIHLRRTGLGGDVLPVSSRLRTQALSEADPELNRESGFDVLVRELSSLSGRSVIAAAVAAGGGAGEVVRDLIVPLEGERRGLVDSTEAAQLVVRLEEATRRYEDMRTGASAWRQLLADGMGDVRSDVEFDLKERIRLVARDAETAIGDLDPGRAWDRFDRWLHERVTHEVVANHTWAVERAQVLLARVETTFADEDLAVTRSLRVDAANRGTQTGELVVSPDQEDDETGVVRRGLVAARGMQGGVVLLSVLGGVLGFTVAAPVVVGLGLALGGRALRDERRHQLEVRRRRAIAGVRKYLDEVSFNASKETRDLLRALQRSLRESLTERADELARSAKLAVEAAHEAEVADRSTRDVRVRALDTELSQLRALQRRADELAALEAR